MLVALLRGSDYWRLGVFSSSDKEIESASSKFSSSVKKLKNYLIDEEGSRGKDSLIRVGRGGEGLNYCQSTRGMADRDWRPFVYGGLASCVAEFGTFPIDTAKTRLQIQGQKFDKRYVQLKYSGMIDAFLQISKQEGFLSLYAGIYPAVLRQATYGTIKFGTYYSLKSLLVQEQETEHLGVNIVCGVVAGIISSSIANPTDVLKVRMQAHGTQTSSIIESFQEVYKQEGLKGLWRGVGPTAQRAAVIAAVELPVYDMCKQHLMRLFGDNVSNHFVSSVIASLGSAVASTPIDVIKTRLMSQKNLKNCIILSNPPTLAPKIYLGTLDCLMQTVRYEGYRALYKGFVPTWFRMGPWNIIFFVTYEQLKKLS